MLGHSGILAQNCGHHMGKKKAQGDVGSKEDFAMVSGIKINMNMFGKFSCLCVYVSGDLLLKPKSFLHICLLNMKYSKDDSSYLLNLKWKLLSREEKQVLNALQCLLS